MNRSSFTAPETAIGAMLIAAPLLFGAVPSWAAYTLAGFLFLSLAFNPEIVLAFRSLTLLTRGAAVALSACLLIQLFGKAYIPVLTAEQALFWSALTVVFLMVRAMNPSQAERLARILVGVAVVEILYGALQIYSGSEHVLWVEKEFHRGFLTGTYFNRNHLAGFLELALGWTLGFLLRAFMNKNRREAAVFSVLLCVFAWGLARTGSRMGVVGFLAALAFMFLFLRHPGSGAFKLFLVVIVLALAGTFLAARAVLFDRFFSLEEGLMNLDAGRWQAWQDGWRMLHDHFWWGLGLGNFGALFPEYQSPVLFLGWNHLHQDYLELWLELGTLGFAVLAVLWGSIFFPCLQRLRQKAAFNPVAWGGMAGFLALMLHGLTDFNGAIPANAYAGMFTLAAASGMLYERTAKRPS